MIGRFSSSSLCTPCVFEVFTVCIPWAFQQKKCVYCKPQSRTHPKCQWPTLVVDG